VLVKINKLSLNRYPSVTSQDTT